MCALSPVSFHREVAKSQGPGPDPPVQTGQVDDHPPLKPCKWSHADRDELVDWLGEFGNGVLLWTNGRCPTRWRVRQFGVLL